ncbi:carbonic anhydrase 2 [Drosophila sulfurigaster albostrigata]|uniref:carbonic anhydrase 2 n=1 Tax=Drosophila sulfurigaster albostrigata TaxID=89887 RepID=UPI002D219E13|nr:carbonic anhydrase 2 [Drosophila sulfurigaster albostrigata]
MWNLRVLALILACVVAVSGQDFGYRGQDGPEHWGDEYKRCSGKYQSPINIDDLNVVKRDYPDLEYINFDSTPESVSVTNNGHTVLVKMSFAKGKEPRVRGGPLERQAYYQFEQFHFHWGENDTVGSEDTINNKAYPAEMHLVVRNLDYPDFNSALGQDHGIAVLAYFFRIKNVGSASYAEFTRSLANISRKGQTIDLSNPLPLMSYVSKDPVNFYSYVGSLTTPPCAEEVVWVDFHEPIDISEDQLQHFRLLTANDDHLKNNFRPTQPLNNRTVYQQNPIEFDHSNSRWGKMPEYNPNKNNAATSVDGSLAALLGSAYSLLLLLFQESVTELLN